MTDEGEKTEKLQNVFDSQESDALREARGEVLKDLEHLKLSKATIELVDLTLFVSNTARSGVTNINWEQPSGLLRYTSSDIEKLIAEDGDTISAELTLAEIWLNSLLEANRGIDEANQDFAALPDDVDDRLDKKTRPAILLALQHFGKQTTHH